MAKIELSSVTEALQRAHTELLADLHRLETATKPGSGQKPTEILAKLEATRQHLAEHFRFEEQNGYMDVIRKREPRLDRTVRHLADEHRHLTQSLDSLIGRCRAMPTAFEPVCTDIRQWIDQVRQHETRENDLVQDAFNLDVSAED